MTIQNAVKALAKHTAVVQNGHRYHGVIGKRIVGFIQNGGDNGGAVCIGTKGSYEGAAWIWYPSLKSAIESAVKDAAVVTARAESPASEDPPTYEESMIDAGRGHLLP